MPHEIFRQLPFPFVDACFPADLGAVVQKTIRGVGGGLPALEVVHTLDNGWLVGDGVNDPNAPGAVIVTGMMHVVDADPSLASLASLRCGEIAQRDQPGQPWRIALHDWND